LPAYARCICTGPRRARRKQYLTPQEYLALERRAETKREYLRGEMFAMSGASREHNLIASNVAAELSRQLRESPYEVYQSNMRVKVSVTGLYTYPDVTVVCGEPQCEDAETDTLLNPTVLVEHYARQGPDQWLQGGLANSSCGLVTASLWKCHQIDKMLIW
jgi:hypothetical protein